MYKQQDLQKANKFFREKQYEQHHHIVHVSRSNENRSNYLESLSSKFTSVDPDIDVSHDKSYLDTLSELKAEKTTWEDYKNKVNLVKNEQLDGGKGEIHLTYHIDILIMLIDDATMMLHFCRTRKQNL